MLNPNFIKLKIKILKEKFLQRLNLRPNLITNETFRKYLKKTHSYKRGKCVGAKINSETEKNERYLFA